MHIVLFDINKFSLKTHEFKISLLFSAADERTTLQTTDPTTADISTQETSKYFDLKMEGGMRQISIAEIAL